MNNIIHKKIFKIKYHKWVTVNYGKYFRDLGNCLDKLLIVDPYDDGKAACQKLRECLTESDIEIVSFEEIGEAIEWQD